MEDDLSLSNVVGSVIIKTFDQPPWNRVIMARLNGDTPEDYPNYISLVLPICQHGIPLIRGEAGYATREEAEAGHATLVEAWKNDNEPELCPVCIENMQSPYYPKKGEE